MEVDKINIDNDESNIISLMSCQTINIFISTRRKTILLGLDCSKDILRVE